MKGWIWVLESVALAAHLEGLAKYGGGEGIRDLTLLQSALAKPQNLAAYGSPDVGALAASYAFGIAKNHPFVDGNKRTALIVAETFVGLNDAALDANEAELVVLFSGLAAGDVSEDELADWFRERISTP